MHPVPDPRRAQRAVGSRCRWSADRRIRRRPPDDDAAASDRGAPRHGSPSTPTARPKSRGAFHFWLGGGLPGFEERPIVQPWPTPPSRRASGGPDVSRDPRGHAERTHQLGQPGCTPRPSGNSRGFSRARWEGNVDRLTPCADLRLLWELSPGSSPRPGSPAGATTRPAYHRAPGPGTRRCPDHASAGRAGTLRLAPSRSATKRAGLHDSPHRLTLTQRQPGSAAAPSPRNTTSALTGLAGNREDRNAVHRPTVRKLLHRPGCITTRDLHLAEARRHRPHRLGGIRPHRPPRRLGMLS